MKILILGGTVFLGRHLVEAARHAGHEVTLFNRGMTNPDLFPDLEKITGERDGGLEVLAGRSWQAAIDTSGYFPRIVGNTVRQLANQVEHYTFISTISVYETSAQTPLDENARVQKTDKSQAEVKGEDYGALKYLCECETEKLMPGRSLIVRPGLIVGPHDPTDRFTYWVRRVAQGGDILAPGSKGAGVQFIDARDLAEWAMRSIEINATGVFNATGPAAPLSMEEFLNACQQTCQRSDIQPARFAWMPDKLLLDANVQPWSELPLWIPEDSPDRSILAIDTSRATEKGLKYRPLVETIWDTLKWDRLRDHSHEMKAGLTPKREAELLEKCKTA